MIQDEKAQRYYIHTFGCQMNVHDSQRMEEVLQEGGYQKADELLMADLIVLNTCSVREKAENKLRSEVGKLSKLRLHNPGLIVAVAGCVAQQEGKKLLDTLDIDVILGPDNIRSLPELVQERRQGFLPRVLTEFDIEAPQFLSAKPEDGFPQVGAFVTTMKGCDERCSFCIVPYTRGKERYRPKNEIIEEIKRHVMAGVKEIVLLGQTVDSYQDPSFSFVTLTHPDETHFPYLLQDIAKEVPSLKRLRYTSPHPRHTTDLLIQAHKEIDILARHVHLPVQSGSNRVLKRMIRRYTREEYLSRAKKLLASHPGFTLSTDVIVGFPGETESDFMDTLSLIEEVGFTSLYGFKYSRRPYTPAIKLVDDVPEQEKESRLARLFELAEKLTVRHLNSLVGTTQHVLFEGPSKKNAQDAGTHPLANRCTFQGKTAQNEIVHVDVEDSLSLTGHLLQVKIIKAHRNSLRAEFLVDDFRDILAKEKGIKFATHRLLRKKLPVYRD